MEKERGYRLLGTYSLIYAPVYLDYHNSDINNNQYLPCHKILCTYDVRC